MSSGTENDDGTTEEIYREYVKMQRDIVSGKLICSKEEAATLAAVQIRLETWPDENLQLAEGFYLSVQTNNCFLSFFFFFLRR